jgi:hypothetical protein
MGKKMRWQRGTATEAEREMRTCKRMVIKQVSWEGTVRQQQQRKEEEEEEEEEEEATRVNKE